MITIDKTLAFLDFDNSYAMIGVSRHKNKFSRMLYDQLKAKGYKVKAINPHFNIKEIDSSYRTLDEVPESIKRLIIITPKSETTQIVNHAIKNGFTHIWIQQSCETPESIELCKTNNITYIHNQCLFMVAQPVKGIHAFHRSIKRFFGSFPKPILSN